MKHDWPARLEEVIEAHRSRSFVWGQCDCCLFAARAVDAMTGSEIEQALLAEYDSETGALRYIASLGGLKSAVSHYLGEPINARPMRGNVVLIDGGEGEAVGIYLGAKRGVVAMGPDGLRFVRTEVKAVWNVEGR